MPPAKRTAQGPLDKALIRPWHPHRFRAKCRDDYIAGSVKHLHIQRRGLIRDLLQKRLCLDRRTPVQHLRNLRVIRQKHRQITVPLQLPDQTVADQRQIRLPARAKLVQPLQIGIAPDPAGEDRHGDQKQHKGRDAAAHSGGHGVIWHRPACKDQSRSYC